MMHYYLFMLCCYYITIMLYDMMMLFWHGIIFLSWYIFNIPVL